MTLWAFAHIACPAAEDFLGADRCIGKATPLGFGVLMSWYERNNSVDRQGEILMRLSSSIGGAAPAAINVAAMRFAVEGRIDAAVAALEFARDQGIADSTTAQIFTACTGRGFLEKSGSTQAALLESSKAASLLNYVLDKAQFGNPESVCLAFESFTAEVLRPARQWLKIAGGDKAKLIVSALDAAPESGAILEIGTYFGYSAMRMAMSQPGRRIVTIEVDAVHALVAQCLIMHAGLAHVIEVRTGHSKDVLPRLLERENRELSIAAIFMDQCGSRFWEDLQAVAQLDILMPGTIVVADNVLKPGAPTFLWHLFFSGLIEDPRVVSVEEFGMAGVEDWIALARFPGGSLKEADIAPAARSDIEDLEWEAHRIRQKASGPGGVSFEEWKAFSKRMRRCFHDLGISPERGSPQC